MKKKVKFSIITVCFNEVAHIRETCESVVEQSCVDFEWIVIDGASTDGTLEILKEYRDRIEILISEPDSGIYNAMNKGIAGATGQYLIFMNGGDWFADKDVLSLVAMAPKKDFIFGDVLLDQGSKKSISLSPTILSRQYLMTHGIPHQACFFKRTLFEKYGNYDEKFRISSDYELIVRFLYKYHSTFFHISQVVSVMNRDGISCNSNFRKVRKLEAHKIRKKYFSIWYWMLPQAIKWEIRRWLS